MADIMFYSTNLKASKVDFKDALLKGLAPDGGLYMPERIPQISKEEIASYSKMPYHEIAFHLLSKFLSDIIPDVELARMTQEAYNFEVPLEKVYDEKYIMRLDQGPTASFKDFAARMMGQLMQYFLENENKNLLILTATSGDTGSAMANAFYGLHNINVCVLFPETEVTERQRKQMTTLHDNVQVLALDGKFDDCQALVKKAFNDRELDYLNLSSANSINIGRLLPQAVYYVYAYSRLCDITKNEEIVFSVPSGNFGDLMGGLLAKNMGLPVKKFVIATNTNDEVPVYFASGNYKTIVPSKACISSAMNVGHPSNMARIVALYGGMMNPDGEIITTPDLEKIKADMFAVSVDDATTRETLKRVYERHKVLLEPHGSVGWEGLCQYLNLNAEAKSPNQVCVSLETAHPAKFPEEIEQTLGITPELPVSLSNLDNKEEQFEIMGSGYEEFKDFLKKKYN
jgi:threonine synthase